MNNRDLEFILRFKNEARQALQDAKKDLDALGKEARQVALQNQLLAKSGMDIDKAFTAVSKQAAQTNAQLKTLEATSLGTGAAFGSVARQSQVANVAAKEMATSGQTVASVWANVRNVLLAVGGIAFARRAISEMAEFESQMQQVRAVAGGTADDFDALRASALKLGGASTFGASGAASALGELAKAGFTAQEAISSLPGTLNLAAAGGLDIARAAEIASTTVRQFSLTAEDAGHVSDVFAESANRTNAGVLDMAEAFNTVGSLGANMKETLESTAAAIGILANQGIKGGEAGTNLRNIMVGLINPTQAVKETILGLTNAVTGQALTLRDVNPAYNSLSDILKKLGGAATDATVAARLFDARNVNAVGILARNIDQMAKLEDSFKSAAGAAQAMAAVMNNSVAGSFKALGSAAEAAAINFGDTSGLTKNLKTFLDTATFGLRALNGDFDDSEAAVQTYASTMGIAAQEARGLFEGARALAENLRIVGQTMKIVAEIAAGVAVAFASVKILQFAKDFLFAKVAVDAFGASIIVAESGMAAAGASAAGMGARILSMANPITIVATILGTLVTGMLLFGDETKKASAFTDDYERNIRGIIGTTQDYTKAVEDLTTAQRDRLQQESLLGAQAVKQQIEETLDAIAGAGSKFRDEITFAFDGEKLQNFQGHLYNIKAAFRDTSDVDAFRKNLTALSLAFPDFAGHVGEVLKLVEQYENTADKAAAYEKILQAIAAKNGDISSQTGEVKKTETALDDAAQAAKRLASALDLAFNRQSGDLGIKIANVNAQLAAARTGGKAALEALKQQQKVEDDFFKSYASANPDAGVDSLAARAKVLADNPNAAKNLQTLKEQAAQLGVTEEALSKYLETSKRGAGQEDRFTVSLEQKIATMQREAATIGQTDTQRKRSLELFKVEQEALKAGIKNFDISDYAKAYDDLVTAQKNAQNDFFGGMKTAVQKFVEEAKTAADLAADVVNDVANGVGDAIDGIVDGSINSFKDLKAALGRILQQIAADILKYLFINQLISPLLGSLFGGGGGTFAAGAGAPGIGGGVSAGSIVWNKHGNAFSNGNVQKFAKGGVVNGATPFGMAGGRAGIMGEDGAEGILPLKRLSNGDLGVQSMRSEGGMLHLSYSAEFNIDMTGNGGGGNDGTGFTPEQQKMLGDVLNNAVKAKVIETLTEQGRNGGALRNNRTVD